MPRWRSPPKWDEYINGGVRAANRGDYLTCSKMFQAALDEATKLGDSNHQVAKSLDNLAWADMQLKNYSEAEQLYKRLIEIAPSDDASLELAFLYRTEGKFAEAAPIYKHLSQQHDVSLMALRDYVFVLRQVGRSAEARVIETEISWLEHSRPNHPKNHGLYIPRDQFGTSLDGYTK